MGAVGDGEILAVLLDQRLVAGDIQLLHRVGVVFGKTAHIEGGPDLVSIFVKGVGNVSSDPSEPQLKQAFSVAAGVAYAFHKTACFSVQVFQICHAGDLLALY